MAGHDVKVPNFYGENYSLWKMIMEGHLMSLGVDIFSTMVTGYTIPNVFFLQTLMERRFFKTMQKQEMPLLLHLMRVS